MIAQLNSARNAERCGGVNRRAPVVELLDQLHHVAPGDVVHGFVAPSRHQHVVDDALNRAGATKACDLAFEVVFGHPRKQALLLLVLLLARAAHFVGAMARLHLRVFALADLFQPLAGGGTRGVDGDRTDEADDAAGRVLCARKAGVQREHLALGGHANDQTRDDSVAQLGTTLAGWVRLQRRDTAVGQVHAHVSVLSARAGPPLGHRR